MGAIALEAGAVDAADRGLDAILLSPGFWRDAAGTAAAVSDWRPRHDTALGT